MDVFARRFDSIGSPLAGEFKVNTYTYTRQTGPDMAVAANGDFVIVWQSIGQDGMYNPGGTYGVFGQRFASDGTQQGTEFQVNTHTVNDQVSPSIAAATNGNFVVVWQSCLQDGYDYGIFGQRFASNGNPQGTEFQVNSYVPYAQRKPDVAFGPLSEDFLVVWEDRFSFIEAEVTGQLFASDGSFVGDDFQINTYGTGFQGNPAVAASSHDDFVVTWQSRDYDAFFDSQDGSYAGVFGQRLSSTAAPLGNEFQVNNYTENSQANPAIASGGGTFIVVWNSYGQDGLDRGVFGQRFISTCGNGIVDPGEQCEPPGVGMCNADCTLVLS